MASILQIQKNYKGMGIEGEKSILGGSHNHHWNFPHKRGAGDGVVCFSDRAFLGNSRRDFCRQFIPGWSKA
jgi:hypothetical protein